MSGHFDVWAMALAIPATGIMIAMVGKWLFTPVKPIANQSHTNSPGSGEASHSGVKFTYHTPYATSSKNLHVHA